MRDTLGQQSQGTRHADADLSHDIGLLMSSLEEHNVYGLEEGRRLDDSDASVPDVVSVGLNQLMSAASSPLDDFNRAFKRLQRRRRVRDRGRRALARRKAGG